MKPKFILLSVVLFLFMVPILSSHAEQRTIRVAGDSNYPPYEFVGENGEYQGFNVDVIKAIANAKGLLVEIVPMRWEEAVSALEEGSVDVIQGMTVTEYRDLVFDFTDPIAENAQSIFVSADRSDISGVNDLEGARVAYLSGNISYEMIIEIDDIKLIATENQAEAMNALMAGRVDAYVGNRLPGLYFIQRDRLQEKIKLVATPMPETMYALAVAEGNEELLDLLNTGLDEIRSSGAYDLIFMKWFGEVIEEQNLYDHQMLLFLGIVIGISVTGIVFVVWLNKRLQMEVSKRTEELNRHKQLLEMSNRQKDNILESIASGIIVIDNMQNIVLVNSAARRIAQERIAIGQQWSELQLAGRIDGRGYRAALEGQEYSGGLTVNEPRGERVHMRYMFVPILGPEGSEGVILMMNDLTNERNLQDLLSQNDKMNSLSRLSAGIAHELKNPLNSIDAYVKKLPEKWSDSEYRRYFLDVVPSEIDRLNALLGNLLDYTKPSGSKPDYVELDDLFSELENLFRQKVVEKRVSFQADAGELICWADANHLKQVLINLVMNSYEALDERGRIGLVATPERDWIVIKVIDSGSGMPKSKIAKAFEPFYTSKSNGTGIGLAICRQLIVENNGEISIDSILGRGTTVTIKLRKFPD